MVKGIFDVTELVSRARSLGVDAQPNHVFRLHDSCCCGPHPAAASAFPAAWLAGLVDASARQPIKGGARQPIKGGARQSIKGGARQGIKGGASSAVRAVAPAGPTSGAIWTGTGATPSVIVLDTGAPVNPPGAATALSTPWIVNFNAYPSGNQTKLPAQTADDGDQDDDGFLDEAGGHGGFIAGLIHRFAEGTPITLIRVLDTLNGGLIAEDALSAALGAAIGELDEHQKGFITMSFGGTTWDTPNVLALAVSDAQKAGAVVIASAGNDATCEPQYPAALPNVVSVGAIGPDGPAEFTNYGPWVRCCAPGVDMVSTFFSHNFDAGPGMDGDPDDFKGWAMWSGTSFAVPMVAAGLLRDMAHHGRTAKQAVEAVIDAPHLGRIPGLGTVVNI